MTYESELLRLCRADDRVVVLTAENRAAIRALPEQLGSRFIDVGICEQTMIGMAAGLALRGRLPIVHALATFLTMRAFEFIRTDVGIARLPVVLVGAVPGFLSDANGPTHQAIEDIALMRGIPHMRVVCPADVDELKAMLPVLVGSKDPCYVRYNASKPSIVHAPFELGTAELVSDGEDVAILTYGFLLAEAVRAADILQASGFSVKLLNMRTLKPLDERAVLDAAHATNLVVTVEDHFLTGGLYSAVAEIIARNGVRCSLSPFALEERWFRPALLPDILEREGFRGDLLAARIGEIVRKKNKLSRGVNA